MPLFGSKRNPEPEPVPERRSGLFHRPEPTYAEPPARKTSLFHRNAREPSPVSTAGSHSPTTRTGLFHRRNSPTTSLGSDGSNGRHHLGNGLLSKNRHDDQSIIAARERVVHAERLEVEADKARQQAQSAVNNARQEVKRLEKEAELQSRLAKHKADSSKAISKRAQPLGRHGPF